MHRLRLPGFVVAACLLAIPARANLIDFTAITSAASPSLTFGDITITATGTSADARVATVAGVGLGTVGWGSDGSIDMTFIWGDGGRDSLSTGWGLSGGFGAGFGSGLSIIANGDAIINSMTILPYMTIDGPQPDRLPTFSVGWDVYVHGGVFGTNYFELQPFVQTTFYAERPDPFPTWQFHDVAFRSDFDYFIPFLAYRESTNYAASTMNFGFSILSVDYTPATDVPEPATLFVIGIGGAVLGCRRARIRRATTTDATAVSPRAAEAPPAATRF